VHSLFPPPDSRIFPIPENFSELRLKKFVEEH